MYTDIKPVTIKIAEDCKCDQSKVDGRLIEHEERETNKIKTLSNIYFCSLVVFQNA